MRRNILSLFTLLSAVLVFTSCLGSSDEDSTLYNDTAITSFSLGTLKRTMHTTSSTGSDSTYSTTVTGSNYSFYIDQLSGLIYNPDSLPIGTKAKALCTINSKNSGIIVYKSLISDTLSYYSSSDSIDMSSPRTLFVYATNGTVRRKYTLKVNVHQQDSDTIVWNKMTVNANIGSLNAMKAVEYNSKLYVFGSNGSQTVAYTSAVSDGKTWTQVSLSPAFSTDAYKSIMIYGGYAYIVSDGSVYKSTDMANWSTVSTGTGLKQLIGGSTTELYALNSDNTLSVSADKGTTWKVDQLDADASAALLPTKDISYVTVSQTSNDSTDRVVFVGNRATSLGDTTAVVWTKLVEYSSGSPAGSWDMVEKSEANFHNYLPDLASLVMIPYDNGMLAFGGAGVNSKKTKFSQFYQSYDSGITWVNNTHYYFPKGFSCSGTSVTALSDTDNYIWIFCGESGQIWKGRLNRLGWTKNQTIFTN